MVKVVLLSRTVSMEQENQPEKIQFVIVPEFILTDSKTPIGEKLLFGDIASHTKQKGYCWGSNEYFEKRYKVSSRTISRWINDSVLLLLGPKGVGKIHLGASIIREASGTFISIELGQEAERQLRRELEWER